MISRRIVGAWRVLTPSCPVSREGVSQPPLDLVLSWTLKTLCKGSNETLMGCLAVQPASEMDLCPNAKVPSEPIVLPTEHIDGCQGAIQKR
jgi:hypothetical protein